MVANVVLEKHTMQNLVVSRGEFGAVLEYSNFRLRISLLTFLRPPVARYWETAIVWPRATCL